MINSMCKKENRIKYYRTMSCPRKGYYQDSAQWILKYQCNRKREIKKIKKPNKHTQYLHTTVQQRFR